MIRWSWPISSSREYPEISTELVVDVGDPAGDVGGRDDRRVIERALEIGQLLECWCRSRGQVVSIAKARTDSTRAA